MKVFIKETQEVKELNIIDANGIDWTEDFVNVGSREEFSYNDEEGCYVTDQETFEWWNEVIEKHQKVNDRIAELKEEFGSNTVDDVINSAGDYDLEDQPDYILKALEEAFGDKVR